MITFVGGLIIGASGGFLVGVGFCWGIWLIIHDAHWYRHLTDPMYRQHREEMQKLEAERVADTPSHLQTYPDMPRAMVCPPRESQAEVRKILDDLRPRNPEGKYVDTYYPRKFPSS